MAVAWKQRHQLQAALCLLQMVDMGRELQSAENLADLHGMVMHIERKS